jgi:hypothetical protein
MAIIIRTVDEYVKIFTTVSIAYVRETTSDFPAITYCNLNIFDQNEVFDRKIISDWANLYCKTLNTTRARCKLQYEEFSKYLKYQVNKDKSAHEKKQNESAIFLPKLPWSVLSRCEFDGRPCSSQNFTRFWHNQYGYCYTFNDGKKNPVLQTSQIGPNHGLQIRLWVKYSDESKSVD